MQERETTCQPDPERVRLAEAAPDARLMLDSEQGRRPPSYRVLYRAILDGRLPAKRVGREIWITRDDLRTFITE
jgi:hypothetical protein